MGLLDCFGGQGPWHSNTKYMYVYNIVNEEKIIENYILFTLISNDGQCACATYTNLSWLDFVFSMTNQPKTVLL